MSTPVEVLIEDGCFRECLAKGLEAGTAEFDECMDRCVDEEIEAIENEYYEGTDDIDLDDCEG